MNKYTIGDTVTIRAQLLLNGVGEDLAGYTMTCAIVCRDMKTFATGTSAVGCTVLDEATGEVEAIFSKSLTASIVKGDYFIEFQASKQGSCVTWDRIMVRFYNGAIA